MAPRIFTLLRSPVTGISGGHPTRLQVAWSVESCRKLASSVKRSAQCRERAFFLGRDRCGGAIGPAPQRRRGPARGGAVALKIPSREAICAHGRDDTEHRTPPRSPRQSWATSRCRYPDRKQPDRCREYLLTVAVASLSSPMAGPTDTLPADHRHRRSDTAAATPIPWIAAPAGSPLMRRWYVLRNSAPRPAIVSPHGRPPLFPLLCSGEPTADRCWDAIATGVAPYGLRGPLCHRCPFIYARLYNTSYRGRNVIALMISEMQHGFTDSRWCTYRQAAEKGWQVRKGERGSRIEYWEPKPGSKDPNADDDEKHGRLVHKIY